MARRPPIASGSALLLLLATLAVAAPWIASSPPERQDLSHRLEGPSADHPLGLDDLGRDVLSRLLWGARISMTTGLLVVLLAGSLGVLLGSSAGLAGGAADASLVALVDLLLGFPGVLLAIALVAVLGPKLQNLILALCLIGWVPYARLARGQVLRLKRIEFLDAARSLGAGPGRLVLRHLLPNLLGPVIIQAALGLGGVILAEAGLSFLGLGVPPPAPSWGSMLRSGTQSLLDAPHLTIVPGVAIFLAVLGANLLGEGLGAKLDPGRTVRDKTLGI
ncbi:MAG TPA: ABC transporter permease [Candidatus Polarisedimenticolia bacterium]|nr:ABC transporter permease [Candidatus Polarisedimenticolia bacterium]